MKQNKHVKMDGRKPSAAMKLCSLLVVMVFSLGSSIGQENETDSTPSTRKLEDAVFADMLKIVDNKFDTLTTRLTAIESAVSNLQLYSIRHFRQISGSLKSTDNYLETIRKQVTQIDEKAQVQKASVNMISNDVSELKKTSADLLGEFESGVFYVNENLDKQGTLMKTLLDDMVIKTASETSAQISKDIGDIIQRFVKQKPEPTNCDVDFSSISEHIDLRFAEFKMQTHAHFVKLTNAVKIDLRRGKRYSTDESENDEGDRKEKEKLCECKTKVGKDNNVLAENNTRSGSSNSYSRNDNSSMAEPHQPSRDENKKYQNDNDEQVMNALYNMTGSVLQAVSYFRSSGRLLEQILSNTDTLASQQMDFNRRLGTLAGWHSTADEESDRSNVIPRSDNIRQQGYSTFVSGDKAAENSCIVPTDLFHSVTTIAKNSSQLLEVLTDLAQLSSVSLSNVSATLQDEVNRLDAIRSHMAMIRTNRDETDPVTKLANATQRSLTLIEGIASNTGWLPEILSNVQNIESLTNHSIYAVMQNHALLSMVQIAVSTLDSAGKGNPENTSTSTQMNRGQEYGDKLSQSKLIALSKNGVTVNRETLETIYNTSMQLNRIMPALLKLLSEPDPLITLVGGGRQDQGRVEIYHNGLWGAICHTDLSHSEADLICRHLGFRGGISAGAGHFGAGAGITWIFNASCLVTTNCPVVTYSESSVDCSHDLDTGVICDHMLRIVSSDGSTKGKQGRLEIHHRGVWLPVCGAGWSGYSARLACQQMGFADGREMGVGEWLGGANTTWLSSVSCNGHETRLDVCHNDGWRESCLGMIPAGVRCV